MRRLRYRRGFGHGLGLLYLVRHPLALVVVAVVLLAVYLYMRRR